MWKRNQQAYARTTGPETPYQRAAQVWDDRIGSARVQAQNWRIVALIGLGLSCALAGAYVWRSSQSIVTPYVVEIEQDGGVRSVAPTIANYIPSDAQTANQLAGFIKNVRSVSIDPIIVRENWLEAYNYTTDRAAATLNDYARDHDPFAGIGSRSVSVDISSVVRSSDDSFEIRWRETSFANGAQQSVDTFTASLSIIIKPPHDEATLIKNPLGIYVHGLNWSKDLTQGASK